MKIIAVATKKGGVGKTTLATNFAVELSAAGERVCLIDTDPQGSAATFRAVRENIEPTFQAFQMLRPTLQQDLVSLGNAFDWVIIDTAGRDGAVFRSALLAADKILVPIEPGAFGVWATQDVFQILGELALEQRAREFYLVLNRLTEGTIIARETFEAVSDLVGDLPLTILPEPLAQRTIWARAGGEGLGVAEMEPGGKAAAELRNLCHALGFPPRKESL